MRCLIVGGAGWVGRALTTELATRRLPFVSTGSLRPLAESMSTRREVRGFFPNTLIFLAGVTPSRAQGRRVGDYQAALSRVTTELELALDIPGIRKLCYLSSGVVDIEADAEWHWTRALYREAKIREESMVASHELAAQALLVRVYSLTGPHLERSRYMAFHDLIAQALRGSMEVKSGGSVYRSYVSVTDLAKVLLGSLGSEICGLRRTGGVCLELSQLAEAISKVLAPQARLEVSRGSVHRDFYCGDDWAWRDWCKAVNVVPMTLQEQITETSEWVVESNP